MRLRCTRSHRRPTRRSSRISTRPVAGRGDTVPETATLRPRRTRREERARRSSGRTRIAMGEEASGGRAPSPAEAARTEPLRLIGTVADQLPSARQGVAGVGEKGAPRTADSVAGGGPAGGGAAGEGGPARG